MVEQGIISNTGKVLETRNGGNSNANGKQSLEGIVGCG